MEGCGGIHNDLKQLHITKLKFEHDLVEDVAICPACGELFDKDDFPEIVQQSNQSVSD